MPRNALLLLVTLLLVASLLLVLHACWGATPAILSLSASVPIDPAAAWPMEGLSLQRDRATLSELQLPLRLRQTLKITGDTEFGSPVTVAGGLLFAESEKQLHALDASSGRERWHINLPGFYLSPAIDGERVFVRAESGSEGWLWALDVNTGQELWRFQFPLVGSAYDNVGGHVTSPVVADGLVVAGAAHYLYAVDAASGEARWVFSTDGPIAASASIADGTVYIADFECAYAVDLETGQEVWRFEHQADSISLFFAPVIIGDEVLITSYETAYALDRGSGQVLWSQTIPSEGIVPGAAAGDLVYVKAASSLFALERETGAIRWSYVVSDYVSLPALAGEQVFVITRDQGRRHLRALQSSDGREIWKAENAQFSNAAPVVAGGRVYVRTANGQVLAYGS